MAAGDVPRPELWIHPKAAKKYAIEDGDWVWVEGPVFNYSRARDLLD